MTDVEAKVVKTSNDPTLLAALGDTKQFNTASSFTPVHPDDPSIQLVNGDKPIILYYVGMESDNFHQAILEIRKVRNNRVMEKAPYDPKWDDEPELCKLSYCITGWDNLPKTWLDGSGDLAPVAFAADPKEARAQALALMTRLSWLRLQAQIKMWTREPFGKASSTS